MFDFTITTTPNTPNLFWSTVGISTIIAAFVAGIIQWINGKKIEQLKSDLNLQHFKTSHIFETTEKVIREIYLKLLSLEKDVDSINAVTNDVELFFIEFERFAKKQHELYFYFEQNRLYGKMAT